MLYVVFTVCEPHGSGELGEEILMASFYKRSYGETLGEVERLAGVTCGQLLQLE